MVGGSNTAYHIQKSVLSLSIFIYQYYINIYILSTYASIHIYNTCIYVVYVYTIHFLYMIIAKRFGHKKSWSIPEL